jgi:two-component system alkaline phosphatase synthesis response regulator PhoP
MAYHLLLIEDEPGLVLTLTDRLQSEGYRVTSARDGTAGLAEAALGVYDLIVLDVMLPGKNGFDLCRDLRQRGLQTPLIMLTARGQVVDRVVGLKLGADDYLTKPFEMIELLARVEALLRRRPTAGLHPEQFHFGDLCIDFRRAEVLRGGDVVELSAREYRLLSYFVAHRGATLSREAILSDVWGYDDELPATRTVDVHVAWLRQKLEPNPRHPRYILTAHGLGYRFEG